MPCPIPKNKMGLFNQTQLKLTHKMTYDQYDPFNNIKDKQELGGLVSQAFSSEKQGRIVESL